MKFRLKSCVWELTLACCFSCEYCGSKAGRARENELTTQECLRVADELADLGCRRVSMIGGEVFMRGDWAEVAGQLIRRAVKVSIITNGFLFSERLLETICSLGLESVAVSVDGAQSVHDRFRQKGSFQRAKTAVYTLAEHGIPVSVISTLNAENVRELEAFYETIQEWPIFAWQIQACSPMGNAKQGGLDYRFSSADVIRFVASHMYQAPFAMGFADNIGYFTEDEGALRGNLSGRAYFTGCRAGLTSIGIDSVGNVRGCESMYDKRFIEGNLREKSLREIWESPEAFAYNRQFSMDMLTGKCATCTYGSVCAGGCRSYNYFVHQKMYEAPFCAREL